MTTSLQALMNEATRLTQAGDLSAATAAIQRALAAAPSGGGLPAGAMRPAMPSADGAPDATHRAGAGATHRLGDLFGAAFTRTSTPSSADPASPGPGAPGRPDVLDGCVHEAAGPDRFTSGTYSHGAITRDYKLYLPPGAADTPRPLVVMLHGCTQDPDDFAAGTGMNRRARDEGFAVLYPAQSTQANPSRCWNWFKHTHQQRGRGEPAFIAALAQAVCARHGLDTDRVFVAGLSAGGAMAAVLGATYPDVFAAVGVHSGLAPGVAGNLPDALAAMQGGSSLPGGASLPGRAAGAKTGAGTQDIAVPTIVFHGDHDHTVHPRNGEQVIAAAQAAVATPSAAKRQVHEGESAGGRRYTRATHHAADGRTIAEHWVVHGAGHAWAGGAAAGSYTDAAGPDATAEMLRFFMAHGRTDRR